MIKYANIQFLVRKAVLLQLKKSAMWTELEPWRNIIKAG